MANSFGRTHTCPRESRLLTFRAQTKQEDKGTACSSLIRDRLVATNLWKDTEEFLLLRKVPIAVPKVRNRWDPSRSWPAIRAEHSGDKDLSREGDQEPHGHSV